MLPYCADFKNELLDAFSRELPIAIWIVLARELECTYLLRGQHLPVQGRTLRDVYFPADATVAVFGYPAEQSCAVAYIGYRDMTPVGELVGRNMNVAGCRFEVETPGIAYKIQRETFLKIVRASEYLQALVTALDHRLSFRVAADRRLVGSLNNDLMQRMARKNH